MTNRHHLSTLRLVGFLVLGCLLLKPLLLCGHLLLEEHCWRAEYRAEIEPSGGCHDDGKYAPHHQHEDSSADPEDGDRRSHCPHPLEEHLASLRGDLSSIRCSDTQVQDPPGFTLIAAAPSLWAPERHSQEPTRELTLESLFERLSSRPRAPPRT